MVDFQTTYKKLTDLAKEIAYLESASALLDWDQQTHLPKSGSDYRSAQLAYFAGEIHRRRTSPELLDWMNELIQSPDFAQAPVELKTNVSVLKREHEKSSKIPNDLVKALAQASAQGHQRWLAAREKNDFNVLASSLDNLFKLKREQSEAVGYTDSPYDVHIDDYEPGCTTRSIKDQLGAIKNDLVEIASAASNASNQPNPSVLKADVHTIEQQTLSKAISQAIGFDYNRGRLDESAHPFSTGLGPNDVRITTRYNQQSFEESLFGTLHEAGHAMYEQGLRADQYGLPSGKYCSLGIHESQSRLWENLVGRSRGFWTHFYDLTKTHTANALDDVPLDTFYRAINTVQPSLIRVEADEVTYNLHIIIRFELELDMIEGTLSIADLPDAWNQKYQDYLGITPDSHNTGVMQDIHWSAGLIGYFPTYTLGNIYASQLFSKANDELGDLNKLFEQGEFHSLKNWLNNNVHQLGRRYDAVELIESVTDTPISPKHLISYLRAKVSDIYDLQ